MAPAGLGYRATTRDRLELRKKNATLTGIWKASQWAAVSRTSGNDK